MAKTFGQLEKECNALIKLVLSQMEELAAMPPEQASAPYEFNERRRVVVRKIWTIFKESVQYDPAGRL